MFDAIHQHEDLYGLVRSCCEENGIGISLPKELCEPDGSPLADHVVILKVDQFYNTQRFGEPPQSADFLIIVRCEDEGYDLYVVELRNTKQTRSVRARDIVEKFKTVLDDFLGPRFGGILMPEGARLNNVRLYLVTNPIRAKNSNEFDLYMKGTTLDAYGQLPPLIFYGRPLLIQPVLPNPAVENC